MFKSRMHEKKQRKFGKDRSGVSWWKKSVYAGRASVTKGHVSVVDHAPRVFEGEFALSFRVSETSEPAVEEEEGGDPFSLGQHHQHQHLIRSSGEGECYFLQKAEVVSCNRFVGHVRTSHAIVVVIHLALGGGAQVLRKRSLPHARAVLQRQVLQLFATHGSVRVSSSTRLFSTKYQVHFSPQGTATSSKFCPLSC